jgi:hypothetical protein
MAGVIPNGGSPKPHSPRRIGAAQRQAQAIQLRIAGAGFQAIADKLGYRSASGAHKAVVTALAATRQEPADEYRRLHRERLNQLLLKYWAKAQSGDLKAAGFCLDVLRDLAELDGLPVKKPALVGDGGTLEIVNVIVTSREEAEAVLRGPNGDLNGDLNGHAPRVLNGHP